MTLNFKFIYFIILFSNFFLTDFSLASDYDVITKELNQFEKALERNEKELEQKFSYRLEEYKKILDKLQDIDQKIRKNRITQLDYDYVISNWRSYVENSYNNISGQSLNNNLIELPNYKYHSLPKEKIEIIEKQKQNLNKTIFHNARNFASSLETDTLYYNKTLLYLGKLRSKLYNSKLKYSNNIEFSNNIIEDLKKELKIIPVRWTATFHSKILEFKHNLNSRIRGYYLIAQDIIFIVIIFSSIIIFLWFYKDISNYIESFFEISFKNLIHKIPNWKLRYLLGITNKLIPYGITYFTISFIIHLLDKTSLKEISEILKYINYWVIYILVLEISIFTIRKLKNESIIEISYQKQSKLNSSITYIYRYLFINILILHSINTVVGRAILYDFYLIILGFVTPIVILYVINSWKIEILMKFYELTSKKFYYSIKRPSKTILSLFITTFILFCIIVLTIINNIKEWLSRYDFYKRITAKIFLIEVKKSINLISFTEDENKNLPIEYTDIFLNDDDNFFIEQDKFNYGFKVITNWLENKGNIHSLCISGNYGSGKSKFISYTKSKLNKYKDSKIITIDLKNKITNPENLLNILKEYLGGVSNNVSDLIDEWKLDSNKNKIIFLDNCHNIFLSKYDGFEAIKILAEIINADIEKIFWCAAFHDNSWKYINKVLESYQCFDEIVKLDSWSLEDLSELILSKHKRSKFSLSYAKLLSRTIYDQNKKDIIKYTQSRFFKVLWEKSDANPNRAISLWLSSLKYNGYKTLEVLLPNELNITNFSEMDDEVFFLCASIIRHESLTLKQLQQVYNNDIGIVSRVLKTCIENKILTMDASNKYTLNPLYSGNIIKILKRKNYVY